MWTNNNNKETSSNWFQQVLLERALNRDVFKQPNCFESANEKLELNPVFESYTEKTKFKLALQALSPKERTAIILRFKQQRTLNEIAGILGISQKTLSVLFTRINTK